MAFVFLVLFTPPFAFSTRSSFSSSCSSFLSSNVAGIVVNCARLNISKGLANRSQRQQLPQNAYAFSQPPLHPPPHAQRTDKHNEDAHHDGALPGRGSGAGGSFSTGDRYVPWGGRERR